VPIEVPELGDERHQLWCDLIDLAAAFPNRWTYENAITSWRSRTLASRISFGEALRRSTSSHRMASASGQTLGLSGRCVPNAHRSDVALLLQLVANPDELAADLSRTERGWLRHHEYFADRANPTWDAFHAQDREQAALVYRRLIA
jgi:hypothetical protein